MSLDFSVLKGPFAICKLPPDSAIPEWARKGDFFSISCTDEELSIVCEASHVPSEIKATRGWACFKLLGPHDFSQVGLIASLSKVLADAGISIFAISTYNTDYILVPTGDLDSASEVLVKAGHRVHD